MHAKDIMSTPAYTVHADGPVAAVVELLERQSITAVPVTDERGVLVGMVTEGDLLRRQAGGATAGDLGARQIREVMSARPVMAWPDADVADLAAAMVKHDAHTVPVVVEERVVGVVSRCDVLRTMLPTDDAAQREAQHRLDVYADGQHRWPVHVHDTVATIDGRFDEDIERAVAEALVRTTAGVTAVRVTAPSG
ncbi:CBS domain-containing protein [Dactylosporangium cerinum]